MFKFKGIQISPYEAQFNINIYLFKFWEKSFRKKNLEIETLEKSPNLIKFLETYVITPKLRSFAPNPLIKKAPSYNLKMSLNKKMLP